MQVPGTQLALIAHQIARHNPRPQILRTAIPGLSLYRRESDETIDTDSGQMMVSLIAQGAKSTRIGGTEKLYRAGECLACALAVPAVFHTVGASAAEPFLSVSMRIDPAIVTDLAGGLFGAGAASGDAGQTVSVFEPDADLSDAFLRLVKLLDSEQDCRVLGPLVTREIHYRLLLSPCGAALRAGVAAGTANSSILGVIARIKRTYADLPAMDDLAREAHMSPSVFRRQFHVLTGLSPLQFVRRLRLFEAQRRLFSEGLGVSQAAFAVGYSSPGQFIRDYRAFFGSTPLQDARSR
jgi:AraC-like DNA-binding protein